MLYTDNTSRHCSRCGMELTDAASRECGVGPICRKKDNHLYAKAIPANFAGATMCVMSVKVENLVEECRSRFEAMKTALLRRAERAAQANDDPLCMHLTGEDCRTIIRELDWLLSYRMDSLSKDLLVKTVRYLGYVGLAGVLSGKSSTSDAELWFENGRIFLRGLGCTDGFRAMRRITGTTTPRYRGDRSPYSAPAKEAAKFIEIAREFWPCFKGDAAQIQSAADAYVAAHTVSPAPVITAVPTKPMATIVRHRMDFTVSFDRWVHGRTDAVIAGIKNNVPYRERKYDPSTRTWYINSKHLLSVTQLVETVYAIRLS